MSTFEKEQKYERIDYRYKAKVTGQNYKKPATLRQSIF